MFQQFLSFRQHTKHRLSCHAVIQLVFISHITWLSDDDESSQKTDMIVGNQTESISNVYGIDFEFSIFSFFSLAPPKKNTKHGINFVSNFHGSFSSPFSPSKKDILLVWRILESGFSLLNRESITYMPRQLEARLSLAHLELLWWVVCFVCVCG